MIIASIDPATKAKDHAIAIYNSGQLEAVYKSHDIFEMNGIFLRDDVDVVYLEDQFLGCNPQTLKNLAHESGKILGLLELLNIPYELVAPSTWMAWHKIPKKPKEISSYRWKKRHKQDLIDKAIELTNYVVGTDEDCAAAILLGWYAINRSE